MLLTSGGVIAAHRLPLCRVGCQLPTNTRTHTHTERERERLRFSDLMTEPLHSDRIKMLREAFAPKN